jgi:hypothetical protein
MKKVLGIALLSGLLLCVGIGTAQAKTVTPADLTWHASYGTAQASGNWSFTPVPVFGGTIDVSGQLTNSGSGCYHVEYLVSQDIIPVPTSSAAQCGPGTLPLSFSTYIGPLGGVSIEVCLGQAGDMTSCGVPYQLYA